MRYPLYRDLSNGFSYPPFKGLGPGLYCSLRVMKQSTFFQEVVCVNGCVADYPRCGLLSEGTQSFRIWVIFRMHESFGTQTEH